MKNLRSGILLGLIAILVVGCGTDESPVVDDSAPRLVLDSSVSLEARIGERAETSVTVGNDGDADLEATFAVLGDAWLEVAPGELAIEAGESAEVVFSADCEDTGDFTTEVAVATNDPDVQETTLAVILTCHGLDSASLTVSVAGLPAELNPDILLQGPDDFERSLSESDDLQLQGLAPGEYTVTASQVENYLPTEAVQQIELAAGDDEELTVTYELDDTDVPPGSLSIAADNLPDGLDFSAVVESTDLGYDETFTGVQTIDDLAPGDYTVTFLDVEDGDDIYRAPSIDVEILSEENAEVTADYELISDVLPGSLTIAADNLPGGLDFTATITGDLSSYEETFTGAQTIDDLLPGDYTVTFEDVEDSGVVYRAVPVGVEVISEETAVATADYQVALGALEVTVDFPADVTFDLQLHDGTEVVSTETVSGGDTVTFDDLAPQTHTLTLDSPILDQWNNEYLTGDLTGFDQTIDVASGDTATASISGLAPSVVRTEDDAGTHSLREVLGRVNQDTEITFDDAVGSITLSSGDIAIDVSLTITGHADDHVSIVATGDHRIFTISDSAVTTLQNLHLEGGQATGPGQDSFGGAIFSEGELSLLDMTFYDNSANVGGGALYALGDTTLEDTLFDDNSTAGDGGAAVFDGAAAVTITRSLFTSNSALDNGGALYIFDADVLITNSTFYENQSLDSWGGAIHVDEDGVLDLVHVSIVDNSAPLAPGLYYNDATTIRSTLIAGNGGGTFVEIANVEGHLLQTGGYNFIERASDSTFTPLATDIIGDMDNPEDAQIDTFGGEPGQLATVSLLPTSGAYRAIPENDCVDLAGAPITEDQRGVVRPVNGMCTIGAWEDGDPPANGGDPDPDPDWTTIETFDNATDLPGNTYTDGGFTGVDGVVWTYDGARSAEKTSSGDNAIDGEGIIFASGSGFVRADSIPDGVNTLYLDYRKAFTGGSDREFEVLVNDTVVATSPVFGGFSGADDTIFVLEIEDLDVDGAFSLEVRNIGAQFTVDNIRWR